MLFLARACADSRPIRVGLNRPAAGGTGGVLRTVFALCAVVFALLFLAYATDAKAEQKFLEPEQAFTLTVAMATPTELDVHYRIAPAYYMYRERFEFALAPDAQLLGAPEFPAGIVKYDPNFEKDVEVYHDQVTIQIGRAHV